MELNVQSAPFLWVEDGNGNGQLPTPRTRRRIKKKKEFVGWGSKQLIEFLESIGMQTAQPISQHDIANTIIQYINEKKLLHPERKKRVICDEKLHALFGRKSVGRIKIHELLGDHLLENQTGSDDDSFLSSEEEEDGPSSRKKQKISNPYKKAVPKKKVAQVPKSSLAAVSPQNIKLVYLKRSLVQELLKHPDDFESKVVGSFVRIKSDPLDIFQKNSHVIQLVTGVKCAAVGDSSSRTLLQISGMTDDVSISALSDDDFTEEECDDLRQRVKDGLLKQPTVGELEQKVEVLHEDITKHWLARELVVLKNLIDRANEKGWRHKVAEYLDRRKLLQTPDEQSRLLSEIPKVAPEVKPDPVVEDSPDVPNQEADNSPKAMEWDWEACYDSPARGAMVNFSSVPENQEYVEKAPRVNGGGESLSMKNKGIPEAAGARAESNGHDNYYDPREGQIPKKDGAATKISAHTEPSVQYHIGLPNGLKTPQASNGGTNQSPGPNLGLTVETTKPATGDHADMRMSQTANLAVNPSHRHHQGSTQILDFSAKPSTPHLTTLPSSTRTNHEGFSWTIDFQDKASTPHHIALSSRRIAQESNGSHLEPTSSQPVDANAVKDSAKKPVEVIDLSDSDDDNGEGEKKAACSTQQVIPDTLDQLMWHYFDPQGRVQGPFSLRSLKRWRDANYFNHTFKVWRADQTPNHSALLTDILLQFFPT